MTGYTPPALPFGEWTVLIALGLGAIAIFATLFFIWADLAFEEAGESDE